ncbi:hypothetical protein O6H91_16G055100 [Diphasiastrum complanatum]|nr:hypothetical protein O6H91_16G055100 [Diphasiastrum complanatum]
MPGSSHIIYKRTLGGRKNIGKYATDVVNRILSVLEQFGWCQQTLEELQTLELQLTPYQVAKVLNRQKDSDLALAFFQWAQVEAGCQHDRFSYTTLIKVVARARRLELIEGILEEMKEVNCELDPVAFTVAIRAFAQAGDIEKAMKIFSEMKDHGCEPDQVTYTVLLKMFADAKLPDKVFELYKEMLQNGKTLDTMAYNTLIHSFTKLGQHNVALKFSEEMKANGCYPSIYTYSILILLHAKAGRLDLCLEQYKEMKRAGFRPREVVVTTLLRAIKEAGNLEEAQNLFADIQQAGLENNEYVYSILFEMWAKAGDAKSATDCFNRMVKEGIKVSLPLCNVLIALYVKQNMFDEAQSLLASFPSLGLGHSLETITQVLHFLSKCSEKDEEITKILLHSSRGGEAHTFLSALTSGTYKNEALTSLVQDFFDGLKSERRFLRHKFIDALINLLYWRDQNYQACCIWEVAVDFLFFDYVFEEPIEGIWSVNMIRMEEGTAVICLTKTFEYFKRQFGRKEFSPKWVQIKLGNNSFTDAESQKLKVNELLSTVASPFRVESSDFICHGEALLQWLNDPKVESHFGLLSDFKP